MASVRKLETGKWIAQVRVKGYPAESKTFNTKLEAQAWAVDSEMRLGKRPDVVARKTLGDAFARYREEVSPTKKGARWEGVRLKKLERDELAMMPLQELTTEHLQGWVKRQTHLSGASINRELHIISSVLNTARREWKWMETQPMKDVRKPKNPPPRDRRISEQEISKILQALQYEEAAPVITTRQKIAVVFLLALETAMRRGEILGLEWPSVYLEDQYITLHDTKNGTRRNVPLSKRAVELLRKVYREGPGRVFAVPAASCEVIFRRAVLLTGIENLHFHDTRHEAISRLARKLEVLDLARMVGHKDLRSLMIYYNATAKEIAGRLG